MPLTSASAGLDVGQARVDEDDVGLRPLDGLEGRPHVAGAPDDLDLAGHTEELGEALLNTAIGIDDDHPRWSST